MKSKKASIWEKLQDAESAEWSLDEVKTAIHWFRQFVSFLCGFVWGLIPLTGFNAFISQVAVNFFTTIVFYTTVMKIEPEEFGGHATLTQEGMPPSISMFLLIWIITYSLLHF